MKVEVVKNTDKELELRIEGEGHTLLNFLVDELNNLENVSFAAYSIDHPLSPFARLRIVTREGSPADALKEAWKHLEEELEALKLEFQKEFAKLGA